MTADSREVEQKWRRLGNSREDQGEAVAITAGNATEVADTLAAQRRRIEDLEAAYRRYIELLARVERYLKKGREHNCLIDPEATLDHVSDFLNEEATSEDWNAARQTLEDT